MRPSRRSRPLAGRTQRRTRARWGACAVVLSLVMVTSRSASAGGGAATDAYEDIREGAPVDVHGLVDLYTQRDFEHPSGPVQLRAFDVRSDALSLDFARLTVAHRPDLFGFRLDAGVGDIPDGYLRTDPAQSAYPDLSRALSYVEQAFVTLRVPGDRGVSIDVGKFATPVGLEDNEPQQNWNYSRSLLYTWAEPTFHTGLRVTVPTSETFAVSAFWVNGWDANVLEGDGLRSFAAAASWRPVTGLDLTATYMGGLERALTQPTEPRLAFRHIFDGGAIYWPSPRVAVAVTADYALDAASGGVSWWGIGGYLHYRPLPWLAGTLRGEHYADPDGFTTGAPQRLAGLTATIEVKGEVSFATLIGRLEYRREQSDVPVFETATPPNGTRQDTLALALMAMF